MELYLLRHGIAEDVRPGQRDADRALTGEGKKKLRAVLKSAREAGLKPDLILTSPLRRAVETATVAAEVLDYGGELFRTKTLQPDAKPEAAWEEVRLHREAAQILLSGHEPLFSELTAYLLCAPSLRVDFKKGALVRIDFDAVGPVPRGVLKWMLAPKLAG